MECLACFLSDSYQAKLRKIAQLQHDRFEDVIDSYRDLFINELDELKTNECRIHGGVFLENNYIKKLLDFIKKFNKEEIVIFFEEIKEIYLLWLKSQSILAVEKLKELLKEKGLFDFTIDISKQLMFRGRWKGDNILTSYDMFHIPYDKRYLIGNQRYSLPGIPLLYLGGTPLVVYSELGADINSEDISKISISYFSLKGEEEKNVYNLVNPFYELLQKYKQTDDFVVEPQNLIKADITKKIFQFIFMSLCSFEKRTEQESKKYKMFYEEYVIPQILTQALIQVSEDNKIDGIQYSSTRLYSEGNDKEYKLEYKKNIVLFTTYTEKRHYDFELYQKFEISRPIDYLEISKNKISEEKLKVLNDIILEKDLDELVKKHDFYRDEFMSVEVKVLERDLKDDINREEAKKSNLYINHKVGEVHRFLMYNYFLIKKNKKRELK